MELRKIEHNFKREHFYKMIKNKQGKYVYVLDFEKISKINAFWNLIITQRGAMGKTYNVKEFIKNKWDKEKALTIWIRNMVKDIQNEANKFLYGDIPDNLKGCYIKGQAENNSLYVYDETDTAFIKLQAMNTAEDEKGTRILYNYWVMDEFNVNVKHIRDYIAKYDDLLHSTEDIVNNYGVNDNTQQFIFGNNKTWNHPLLYELGINGVEDEIEIYVDEYDNVMLFIFTPIISEQDYDKFLEDNKHNKRVQATRLIGRDKHSYQNKSEMDNINNIYQFFNTGNEKLFDETLQPIYSFKIDGKFFIMNLIHEKYRPRNMDGTPIRYHVITLDSIEKQYKKFDIPFNENEFLLSVSYTTDISQVEEKVLKLPSSSEKILLSLLSESEICYENIHSKNKLRQLLKA